MSNLQLDKDSLLSAVLSSLTPREAIDLGIDLCAAVESRVGDEGCHGSIWPGNIQHGEGRLLLGEAQQLSIKEMSPDALEYIAPEQFWNGESSPAADVYAIGLILYTALNGGIMPFFDGADSRPEARAAALQSRMRGKALPYPRTAGRELGEVILRAVAFRKEDRFPHASALRQALQALSEGAAVPAAVPVIPLTQSEVKSARSYKVDKEFEKTDPVPVKKAKPQPRKAKREQEKEEKEIANFRDPKSKPGWLLPLVLLAAAIAVLVFALKGCDSTPQPPVPTPDQTVSSPTPDTTPTPTPELTPPVEVTAEPTPSIEPSPLPSEPVLPSYQLVVADVSWEQAKAACEAMGGHLATVKNDAELQAIITLMEDAKLRFCWLGAYRSTADNNWYYVTGEPMTYAVWDVKEPSAFDADGTAENYLLMWHSRNRGIWCFNDTRNDPVSLLPATYSGETAYICQFD